MVGVLVIGGLDRWLVGWCAGLCIRDFGLMFMRTWCGWSHCFRGLGLSEVCVVFRRCLLFSYVRYCSRGVYWWVSLGVV